MGTQVQARELGAEDFGGKRWEGCIDYLSLTRPDVVEAIHAAYFEAGADVVETNSFQASRTRLEEWGLGDRTVELNRAAAADRAPRRRPLRGADGRPRFVAGSIGPSGFLPSSEDPDLGRLSLADLVPSFADQAQGLIEGGADLLHPRDLPGHARDEGADPRVPRGHGAHAAGSVPIQCSITLDPTGRMLLGTDYRGALATLEAMQVDVIGLNCSTGPDLMRDAIRYLCENAVDAGALHPQRRPADQRRRPHALPDDARRRSPRRCASSCSSFGVNIVGGCCGTTPEHIRALVARRRAGVAPRAAARAAAAGSVSSGMTAAALRQEPRAAADRRAAQHAGLAQGQAPRARGHARGHGADRARAGRGRRARARRLHGAHRAHRRGSQMMRALVKKLSLTVEAPL